jgi:hypothetical protein
MLNKFNTKCNLGCVCFTFFKEKICFFFLNIALPQNIPSSKYTLNNVSVGDDFYDSKQTESNFRFF